jgi:hypothetical protein
MKELAGRLGGLSFAIATQQRASGLAFLGAKHLSKIKWTPGKG